MMFRSKASRWVVLGSLAALLVAAGVAVAADGEGGRHGRRAGTGRFMKARRMRMARTLDRLNALSDDQARVALGVANDLAKIREEARGKVAAVLLQAHRDMKAAGGKDATPEQRKAIHDATRGKLKAIKAEYKAPFAEAGMKIVKSLTPEQRQKIEEGAKAHGKTIDDAKLALWFGGRLSHPMAAALLKARLDAGAAPAATPTVPVNK